MHFRYGTHVCKDLHASQSLPPSPLPAVISEATIISGGQAISKVRLVEEDNEVGSNWESADIPDLCAWLFVLGKGTENAGLEASIHGI